MKRELHIVDPTLGLLNVFNEINDEKWRDFKRIHSITSATMNVLLEQPSDDYWKDVKQTKSMNKTTTNILSYAIQFLKVFMERRTNFIKPQLIAHYKPYDITTNKHIDCAREIWKDSTVGDTKFGIIDFQFILVVLNKRNCMPIMSYFYAVVTSFKQKNQPMLEEIMAWLFMCSDMMDHVQI